MEVINSKNILEIFTVATEFCIFTESAAKYEIRDMMQYYQKILPLLYLKGSMLNADEPEDNYAAEKYVTETEWEAVFRIFREKLGKSDEYLVKGQSETGEDVLVNASFAENIADIYQDMKDFTLLYGKTSYDSKTSAVFLCSELFKSRWGLIIPDALKHLHELLYEIEKDNYNNFPE